MQLQAQLQGDFDVATDCCMCWQLSHLFPMGVVVVDATVQLAAAAVSVDGLGAFISILATSCVVESVVSRDCDCLPLVSVSVSVSDAVSVSVAVFFSFSSRRLFELCRL